MSSTISTNLSGFAEGTSPPAVYYPDSDGQPMADNTLQFEWIVTLQGNIDLMFRDDENVFVAGDHLIYPMEGNVDIRQAPDVYVAFGRPKGHRGSYKVFAEDNIFPQVVFEVWSPSNTAERMEEKRKFYEKYGAEEYYILYPDFPAYFQGWRREGDALARITNMNGHISARLGIRFEVGRGQVAVFWPNGRPFLSYLELGTLQQQTEAQAEQERLRAEQEHGRAEQERLRAEQEKQRAEQAKQQAEKLAAKLRELGVDPDAV